MSRLLSRCLTLTVSVSMIGAAWFTVPAGAATSPAYPDYPQCLLRALKPQHVQDAPKARPGASIDGCGAYPALVNPADGKYQIKYELRLVAVDGKRRECIPLQPGKGKCSYQHQANVHPKGGPYPDFLLNGPLVPCNEDLNGLDEVLGQTRVQVYNFDTNSYSAWSGWDGSAEIHIKCG